MSGEHVVPARPDALDTEAGVMPDTVRLVYLGVYVAVLLPGTALCQRVY